MLPVIILIFLFSSFSQAFYFDSNALYINDTTSYSGTANHNRTLIDFAIGFGLGKRSKWVVGWNYASLSTTDVDSVTTSYSTTDMGIKFGRFFNKRKTFSLFLTYNLLVTSKFSTNSGAEEEWRGSSIKAELGHHFWFSESSGLNLRLNYYQASIKEQITGGTTLTTVGYSRNFIYPSIGYIYLF